MIRRANPSIFELASASAMTDNRSMRWMSCTLLAALVAMPGAALAQKGAADSVDAARALGQEAGDLLDQKRYADALERVTRAEALYHAPTHLLMMGEAQEGLGHLAEAANIYERLAAEPIPASAPAAFRNAQDAGKTKLRALLARIPSLLVQVQGPPTADAVATLDGKPLALKSGVAVRVNPGKHTVKVSASGYASAERSLTLPERGGVVIVEIILDPQNQPGVRPQLPAANSTSGVAHDTGSTPSGEPSRLPAWVALGVGGAGVIVGTVTGILALRKVSELRDRCPDNHCSTDDQQLADSSRTFGTVSTISFTVGAVGVGTGALLLLLRNEPSATQAPSARPRVNPWIGLGSAGLGGTF